VAWRARRSTVHKSRFGLNNSKYLGEALLCIESAKEHPDPTLLVKTMIEAMSAILTKIENVPDHNTVTQALSTVQNDLKATTAITKEAAETGKAAAVMLQETNNIARAIQSTLTLRSSYAPVLSSNLAPVGRPITISTPTNRSPKRNVRSS
jgi:hypothetical protein